MPDTSTITETRDAGMSEAEYRGKKARAIAGAFMAGGMLAADLADTVKAANLTLATPEALTPAGRDARAALLQLLAVASTLAGRRKRWTEASSQTWKQATAVLAAAEAVTA